MREHHFPVSAVRHSSPTSRASSAAQGRSNQSAFVPSW
jgi:hypothetical protein